MVVVIGRAGTSDESVVAPRREEESDEGGIGKTLFFLVYYHYTCHVKLQTTPTPPQDLWYTLRGEGAPGKLA